MELGFHPVVSAWFRRRFGAMTEPQALGWPAIASGRDVLVTAPTGSGKTLTAFLMAIDALVRQALSGTLSDATQIVYVSPLKALANDVQKNLEQPLAEILEAAAAEGLLLPPIRVGVRTGDTLQPVRQAMLRRPPHILVTTPESLYILLTSAGGRRILHSARAVIVDEIHALAGNKRGAHLALSLERLDALALSTGQARLQRIGLSATVQPLATVAEFLGGARPAPQLIRVPDRRKLDLAIEIPTQELGPIASNEQWEERYNRLAELAREHRSTLVFVPTRRMAERVAHRMRERLGEDAVAAHHGSLSRAIRLQAENRFKAGKLAMMVATASLELGLDIGSVDLVCQLGSTRQLSSAWQRAGRAGHSPATCGRGAMPGAIPKARFFALTRDDLIECAALVRGLRRGVLDTLTVPPWPRDILAQQIVAEVAAHEDAQGWEEDALFALLRRAMPYRELPRAEFDALLVLLSEGLSSRRGRRSALLHRDGVHHRVRPRRGARLAAMTCGGAIAETASYAVQAEPENLTIGSLDEDFAVESNAGDIILLGNHSWKVRGVETGRVRVEDAHGAPPTIPFWLGEAPGRTRELSELVSELRAAFVELEPGSEPWRQASAECGMREAAARQLSAYLSASREALGAIPTQRHLIAERFFDDSSADGPGGMQLVIHAPFGSAINKAWGMALRKRFCRGFDFELQASASENGLTLALSEQHSFPLETIFAYLSTTTVQDVLEQAVLQAPLFQTRWRWTVSRALALLRFSGGRKLPPQLQRMRAEDLLAAAFPMQVGCQDNHGGEDLAIPDHPYVQEAMRDCLHEFLDLDGLRQVLAGLESGAITIAAVDTPAASPLAHEILNVGVFGFLDGAPLEERRSRAANLRASAATASGPGRLDQAAVEAVCAEAWPQPSTPDELHDLLLSLLWMPEAEIAPAWRPLLEALAIDGRVRPHREGLTNGPSGPAESWTEGWIATERSPLFEAAPTGVASPGPELAGAVWPGVEFAGAQLSPEETQLTAIVGGWMEIAGPVSAAALAKRLGLGEPAVDAALLALEGMGRVLRGEFARAGEPQWCERALLARIHRRMVRRLRAEIEPVSPAVFERFLRRWQHVEPSARLHGLTGLDAVLEQLQGFEAPASAWEHALLAARVADYEPSLLDQLCLGGDFAWARISPRRSPGTAAGGRRVQPTRNSPITFFRRQDAAWLLPMLGWKHPSASEPPALSPPAAQVFATLQQRGACFFSELAGGGPSPVLVKSQVEDALWELVASGLATADGFDNLRAFLDPKRRSGEGKGSLARPRHSRGRWALVSSLWPAAPETETPELAAADLARAERAEKQARLWLRRYGVIFRALLERESSAVAWYDVLLACRRLEARGEIRGGRFVSGFAGEQYALPQAVEALRAVRRLTPPSAAPLPAPALHPADPLSRPTLHAQAAGNPSAPDAAASPLIRAV